jgi:hypothetical protein
MKRKLFALLALFIFASSMISCKFTMDHKGKTIEINAESLQDHLDHGDKILGVIPDKGWDD